MTTISDHTAVRRRTIANRLLHLADRLDTTPSAWRVRRYWLRQMLRGGMVIAAAGYYVDGMLSYVFVWLLAIVVDCVWEIAAMLTKDGGEVGE